MRILILGGTVFLGRALVNAALTRGHELTLFHRGKHNPDLYPDVERIFGDRDVDRDLDQLHGKSWDAVIDTCGYFPRQVRSAAERLAEAVEHYAFISSVSVYDGFATPGINESAPVGILADPGVEEITGETYGPLKALCEAAAETVMPGRVLNVRPGLIVGPHDPSDRFTYWPVRISRGGDILSPDRRELPVQIIDVRDLAEWTVRMVEQRAAGVFNATGPDRLLTMGEVLDACRAVTGSSARLRWVE